MDAKKVEFIEFLLQEQVLRFGDFVTKSGRNSPYFLNFGNICRGASTVRLTEQYAQRIQVLYPDDTPCLFGPAYKGIPLVVGIAQVLAIRAGLDVSYTFDRKENKAHGEKGNFVGYRLGAGDRVLIVEDVLTGGTSIRHTLELLRPLGVNVVGALVGVDRQERGLGVLSARRELELEFGCRIHALLSFTEIISYLDEARSPKKDWIDDLLRKRIVAYREAYVPIEP